MIRTHLFAVVTVVGSACTGVVSEPPSCESVGAAQVELGFINRFPDRTLEVEWTNERCQRQLQLSLKPFEYANQVTLVGDEWRVRDAASHEVLFEGRAPETNSALIFPTSDDRVCSGLGREVREVNFKNRYADRALSLFWVDPACREHAAGEIAPRSHVTVTSVVGHRFRFRRAGTEELVEDTPLITPTTELFSAPSDGSAPQCSEAGTTTSTVGFVNAFPNKTVQVYWVDYQCREVLAGTVAPGQSLFQTSFFTHVFRVRDEADQSLIASPPPLDAASVMVTVP